MPPCKKASAEDDGVKIKQSTSAHPFKEDDSVSPSQPEYDPIMKGVHIATACLSFSMVVWIMFVPASWLIGRSWFHREVVLPYLERQNFFFVAAATSTITKFQDHSLVHFTHLIPSAIWSGIVPFQLHPTWRNQNRKLHRVLGYLFFASCFPVTAGVFIILHRKLTYEHFFPDLEPNPLLVYQDYFLGSIAIWFLITAIQAVRMARAKKILDHKKWMYRHVASGIWIAVQRIILYPIVIVYFKLTLGPNEKAGRWAQRETFSVTGTLAYWLTILLGEYVHRRASMLRKQKQQEKKIE